MTKRNSTNIKTRKFDTFLKKQLKDPQLTAEYLSAAVQKDYIFANEFN